MEDKKLQILKLIEELKFDITPDEAMAAMQNLNEEELQLLTNKYQALANYRGALDDFVAEVDPEEYAKNKTKYLDEMDKVDEEALDQLEKIQEEKDLKLDALDAKSERNDDEVIKQFDADTVEAEEVRKESLDLIDKAFLNKTTQNSAPN